MIYFTQTSMNRYEAFSVYVDHATGARERVVHAHIHEVEEDTEFTIYWEPIRGVRQVRKMTTFHKGDLTGAQNKITKARNWITSEVVVSGRRAENRQAA